MKLLGIILIIIGWIIIAFPDILAYLLAFFLIITWLKLLIAWNIMWWTKSWKDDYVQFWKYKIFKN